MKFEFSEEKYNTLIEKIFTRFPSVQKVGFDKAYKPGLENMTIFAGTLDNPHKCFKTIHVAGTNGKGSVSNMVASVLAASGLKVGLYTSPHILDFRERMRVIDGRKYGAGSKEENCFHGQDTAYMVSREYVYDFLEANKEVFDRLSLSFFEITTGMAFRWFADENVDVAVIEVGLGGRLDSTNIVEPVVSVITSIGLDHCDLLGHTLGEIAGEKAGIMKRGVPVVIGEKHPETEPVFLARAERLSSPIFFAEDCVEVCAGTAPSGDVVDAAMRDMPMILDEMDLQGEYQRKNLLTVFCILSTLCRVVAQTHPIFAEKLSGMEKKDMVDAIVHTAGRMDFHGRWERLASNPETICDIGHNAHALRHNFDQMKSGMESGKWDALVIVYGVMADKDLDDILPLMPVQADYVFTTPTTSRALCAGKIRQRYEAYRRDHDEAEAQCGNGGLCDSLACQETGSGNGTGKTYVVDNVRDAVQFARQLCKKSENPLLYIGGSTFVVSEAIAELQ